MTLPILVHSFIAKYSDNPNPHNFLIKFCIPISFLILFNSALAQDYVTVCHDNGTGSRAEAPKENGTVGYIEVTGERIPNCREVAVGDPFGNNTDHLYHESEGSLIDGRNTGTESECAGNPIMIGSGKKMQFEKDYIGAGEFPLSIERTYNSYLEDIGMFGTRWLSSFDYKLYFIYDNTCLSHPNYLPGEDCIQKTGIPSMTPVAIITVRPDGAKIQYEFDATENAYLDSKSDSTSSISKVGNTWELTRESGVLETYSNVGKVTKRTNINGISHTYTYSGNNLSKVTHSSGRDLDFSWSGGKIISITNSNGDIFQYGYSGIIVNSAVIPGSPTVTKNYHYSNYRLTGIDVNGKNYATFTYNSNGEATSSSHAGNVDRFEFEHSNSHVKVVTNPLGLESTYNYNGSHYGKKLSSVERSAGTYCPAASKTTTYDSNKFEDKVTDWKGNTTDYDYNDKGQLVKKVTAFGTSQAKTTNYAWLAGENRIKSESTDDLVTSYDYFNDGRIKSIELKNVGSQGTFGETRKTSFTYESHSNGILKKRTIDGPRSDVVDVVTYQYDSQGNLTSFTNAVGHITSYSQYDAEGNVGRITDANGLIIDYTYDAARKITSQSIYNSTGTQTTSFFYNAFGQITRINFPDGNYITNSYSDAFRLLSTMDRDQNKIHYTYNNNGDITSTKIQKQTTTVTPPPPSCWWGGGGGPIPFARFLVANEECEPIITTNTVDYFASFNNFDQMGRLRANIGNNGQNTIFAYDDNSNISSITDSLGGVTSFNYNVLNQIVHTNHRDAGATNYSYDSAGRLNSVSDQRGLVTWYLYDGFGNLVEIISPDTGTTTYSYNKAGMPVTKTLADGTSSNYSYDAAGRITSETNGSKTRTYAYDQGSYRKGRLYYVNDYTGQTLYYYDKVGNVTRKRSKIDGIYYNTYYSYNTINKLIQITYPSGHIINYTYNNKGEPLSVTYKSSSSSVALNVAHNLKFKPFGPLEQLTYGNGAKRDLEYDLDYRLTSIYTAAIQDLDYQYDAKDNITYLTNNKVPNLSRSYIYDAEDRLLSENHSQSSTYNHYSYDKVGNRRTKNVNLVSLTTLNYDASSNQLVSTVNSKGSVSAITHNSNGHISLKGGASFTYDDENRLSSYSKSGQITNYSYNALGQRVKKSGSTSTHYLYDEHGRLLAEHNSSGVVQKEYVYLNGEVVGLIKNNSRYYVHNDHLGRAERITNQSKGTVWRASNYAFERIVNTNTIGDFNLGYPGQYFDAESGLHYNYFRDYDPETGRYIQSDPIGLNGGLNTYGYVRGNPTNYVDPFGLLSSRLHRRITKDAIGWSWNNEWGFTLPGEVQRVDGYEGSQLPTNSFWHHMRNGKNGQTPSDAIAKYVSYVNTSISSCNEEGLARALHAVQDSFSPGHEEVQAWMGGMPSLKHIFGDIWPGARRYDAAVKASKNVLGTYKKQCGCKQ